MPVIEVRRSYRRRSGYLSLCPSYVWMRAAGAIITFYYETYHGRASRRPSWLEARNAQGVAHDDLGRIDHHGLAMLWEWL
jgi:hypothetical protein